MSRSRRGRRKQRLPEEPVEVVIESLSAEGRGIAHVDDRVVFVDQALTGERVKFLYTKIKKNMAEAKVVEVLEASADRVEPICDVFSICGGCSLQHMSTSAQLQHKQQTLIDHLNHIGKVKPDVILEPVVGPIQNYRFKARLGVKNVRKKEKVLVGFRERGSSFITDTKRCEVLHKSVGAHLEEIAECIAQLELNERIPQIEVAIGDNQTVLVFRHLDPLPDGDREKLQALCEKHNYIAYLQAGKPDDLESLWPEDADSLYYELVDFDVRFEFVASDFTQVNPEINKTMVKAAIDYLELKETDNVLDLFCGLGNFTLPISRTCHSVTAVEGSLAMVKKARDNADLNQISNVEFVYGDLYSDETLSEPWLKKQYEKVLMDPPRSGAAEVLQHLGKIKPQIIVYVSCHPATLARDADVLVNQLGYQLTHAGILDMFPHTAHVESMAVFKCQ